MGFEHSIANLFFLPYALVLNGFGDAPLVAGSMRNLCVVTGGNIQAGTTLVAGVYWVAYLRPGAVADAGAVHVPDTHGICTNRQSPPS